MKKVWVIVIIALIIGSYFAGVYTTVNHTFPYSNLKFIYKQINFNENEMDLDVDVNSFIHIKTIEDIQNTRNELVDLIDNIVTEAVIEKKKEWLAEQKASQDTLLETKIAKLEAKVRAITESKK